MKWTQADVDKMVELYKAGLTIGEASNILGRSIEALTQKIRITFRREDRPWIGRRKSTREQVEKIKQLTELGYDNKQIAQRVGITVKTVLSYKRVYLGIYSRNGPNVIRTGNRCGADLAPLQDFPKWPGCLCGYCPAFLDIRKERGSIIGTCAKLGKTLNRCDFCIADERPEQESTLEN